MTSPSRATSSFDAVVTAVEKLQQLLLEHIRNHRDPLETAGPVAAPGTGPRRWNALPGAHRAALLEELRPWLWAEAEAHGVDGSLPRYWFEYDAFVDQALLLRQWQELAYAGDSPPSVAFAWHDAFFRFADAVWPRFQRRRENRPAGMTGTRPDERPDVAFKAYLDGLRKTDSSAEPTAG